MSGRGVVFIIALVSACCGQPGADTTPAGVSGHGEPTLPPGQRRAPGEPRAPLQPRNARNTTRPKTPGEYLRQFTAGYKNDRLTIVEFPDYYKITVHHRSGGGMSGGAECYRLDKKTGKTSMLWHEHPQPMPALTPMPVKTTGNP
ncbi:hypothetical protein KKF84_00230 [Myxococcota bacterium]|nr:hypothetical protein [Myxococcota bacterium]MBU1533710.1 hypothetical protein [Myxococcota bacterium]